MPQPIAPDAAIQRIQQLLKERDEHTQAVAHIDHLLTRVGHALNGASDRRSPREKLSSSAQTTSPKRRKRKRRGKFSVSAEASILAFVKEQKNPSTQEITKHWASEGRGGSAHNPLGKLVKQKKLKRTALSGQRGSRYSLPS